MFFSLCISLTASAKSQKLCNECRAGVSELIRATKSSNISAFFESKFCKNNVRCSLMFKLIGETIVNITDESASEQICGKIFKKCRPKMEPLALVEKEVIKHTQKAAFHEETESNCDYCKGLFDYLTGEALQDTTVPVFMKLVKTMCDNIPPAATICEQVTTNHVEKLIMLVTSKFENSELCGSAGMCE